MDDAPDSRRKRLAKLALSAGLSGGVLGTVGKLAYGKPAGALDLAKAFLGTGATAAGLATASGALGDAVLGDPDSKESTPYTKRGFVGGAVGGGLAGGALGALAASGQLGKLLTASKISGVAGLGEKLGSSAPADNLILEQFRKLAANPTAGKTALGALLGGGVVGAGAAYQAGDEGMQLDTLQSQQREQALRKEAKQKARGLG